MTTLIGWPSRSWWYDGLLPWLEPVFTGVAVLAVWIAWRAYKRERDKSARAQAEQVVAWWIEATDSKNQRGANDRGPWAALWYVNTSGLPIYNARFRLQLMDVEITQAHGYNYEMNRSLLQPCAEGMQILFPSDVSDKWWWLQQSSPYPTTPFPRVAIEFTDAADQRWLRGFDGHLKRLSKRDRADYIGAENTRFHDPKLIAQWKKRFPPESNLDDVTVEELKGIDNMNP